MKRTERGRLTALYGALLLGSGAMLVGLVFLITRQGLDWRFGDAGGLDVVPAHRDPTVAGGVPAGSEYAETRLIGIVTQATLQQLMIACVVAFLVFAVLSLGLAWWVAGRLLRPVGVIAATAGQLSGHNITERIRLQGPPGELKNLADTFDGMLDRLERMVGAQRRFAAEAAHELRTFLAVQRTAVEVGLADPDPQQLARIRRRLLEVSDQSEHLVESLLELAVVDSVIERTEPVALDELVADVLAGLSPPEEISVSLVAPEPVVVHGDRALLRSLVTNLAQNAVKYNEPGGRLRITVAAHCLEVVNTGPCVEPDQVPYLFEPFRRHHARTQTRREGSGLGLSIVASIATAHGADLSATANPGGGLTVRVTFRPR